MLQPLARNQFCICPPSTQVSLQILGPVRSSWVSSTTSTKAQRVNIVNEYAPHSGYPVAANDGSYVDLNKVLSKLPQRDTTIILGDFNTKIGQRRDNDSFLGQRGCGWRNRNGHILASFCDANDLFITNTAFRKRARNITTWKLRLKDHCIFNQIDYIICSQRTKTFMQ